MQDYIKSNRPINQIKLNVFQIRWTVLVVLVGIITRIYVARESQPKEMVFLVFQNTVLDLTLKMSLLHDCLEKINLQVFILSLTLA